MLLSAIVFLLSLTALITFWQPHGIFSALVTCFSGGAIILIASFSHHAWAHGLALIGWAVVLIMAASGCLTLALILFRPRQVVRKAERLSRGLLMGIWLWLLGGAGWLWAVSTGHFNDTLWPWLTFIPIFSIYLASLYAASLIGFLRSWSWHVRRADTILVLGAGLADGHQIGQVLQSRLDTALALANAQKGPVTVIVSGGQGPDETISEAAAMAAYLTRHHLQATLLQETAATNTLTNLSNSQRLWMQQPHQGGRVVVVTSDYHLFRTRILAHRLGLRIPGQAAPTDWHDLPTAWAREFLAIVMLHPLMHRSVLLALIVINFIWWLI